MTENRLAILLACFPRSSGAGKARQALDRDLGSEGQRVLDTTVLKVNDKHKASVHDPRRVLMGTLTPALTWGLFGLIANGWLGLLIWGVLGAACGGPYTYYSIHHATKGELNHIGGRLPAKSSALLSFVETRDPSRLATAASGQSAAVASVAVIANDLSVETMAEPAAEATPDSKSQSPGSEGATVTSMILARYHDPDGAHEAAQRVAGDKKLANEAQVELVIKTDPDGRRHVADPKFGVAATAKFDIVGWGGFGVVAGAIAGASGGGILEGGVVTGIAWAIFGIFAGSVYGLWAGRSISARRLKSIGRLLAPGTSAVLAWTDGPPHKAVLDALGTQHLVLHFNPVENGAVIENAGTPPT